MLCTDCVGRASGARAERRAAGRQGGGLPGDVRRVIALNPWILLTAVSGVFLVGLPLQTWLMIRLLDGVGRSRKWPWVAGASVPWVGLIVIWVFLDHAQTFIDERRPRRKPLTTVESIEYDRLAKRHRIACRIAFAPIPVGFFSPDSLILGLLGVIGVAAVVVTLSASIHLIPYRKKLRAAGYVKLFFAGPDPVAKYQQELASR